MKYKVDYADDTLENKERALRVALGTLVETALDEMPVWLD